MSVFWDEVLECDHKNLYPDYFVGHTCTGAVGCRVYESHCKDCGVYISECACMTESGMSGWPWYRWLNYYKKRGWIR